MHHIGHNAVVVGAGAGAGIDAGTEVDSLNLPLELHMVKD
jgi:hypothetical protein